MALQRQYEEKEFYTEDDYFAFEQTAFGRWEYVGGVIRAMADGTDDHNAIVNNVGRALGNAMVPRGCRVYTSDMKVRTGDGINTFPDVSIVCGLRRYHRGRTDVITNPLLIVEVLSPSTEGYDWGENDHYQTIPTLADYVLVAVDEPHVLISASKTITGSFGKRQGRETVYIYRRWKQVWRWRTCMR